MKGLKGARKVTEEVVERRGGRGRYDRSLSAEQRATAQRESIVEACRGLLVRGGPSPTVSEIVAASGVGRNTFYEHFEQAKTVADEVLDAAQLRLEKSLRERRSERRLGPAEAIRGLNQAWADCVGEQSTLVAVLVEHRRPQVVAALRRELEVVARMGVNAGYCPKRALDPLRLRALAAAGVELVSELRGRERASAREAFAAVLAGGLRAN